MDRVRTGLEQLLADPPAWLRGQRLGLLCNPASVDHRWNHARDLSHRRFPGALRALFSPQHGFFAEKQDNMIESADMTDPVLGIPILSLYGATRIPHAQMFGDIDVLLVGHSNGICSIGLRARHIPRRIADNNALPVIDINALYVSALFHCNRKEPVPVYIFISKCANGKVPVEVKGRELYLGPLLDIPGEKAKDAAIRSPRGP